ncbi:MAG: hypothetical protein AB7C98_00015 [Acidithiobacillus sp.]
MSTPIENITGGATEVTRKQKLDLPIMVSDWAWVMLKQLSVTYGVISAETLDTLILDAVLSGHSDFKEFCGND